MEAVGPFRALSAKSPKLLGKPLKASDDLVLLLKGPFMTPTIRLPTAYG
jgi:hypothetical protein